MVIDIKARPTRERDQKLRKLLQSPDAELVSMIVGMVNLSDSEAAAVELCLRRGMTQEQAAERLDCSVEALQKWSRSARDKLWTTWSGRWWLRLLMDA